MDMDKFNQDLKDGCKLACFGSRETPAEALELMRKLAVKFATLGAHMASGHCQGADLAWEEAFCTVAPARFLCCLPWFSYNKEIPIHSLARISCLTEMSTSEQKDILAIAKQHHPAWSRLTNGGQLLQGRNMLIAEGAEYGFTYLNHSKPGGGGSGQCTRYLRSLNVPVIDLSLAEERVRWTRWLNAPA